MTIDESKIMNCSLSEYLRLNPNSHEKDYELRGVSIAGILDDNPEDNSYGEFNPFRSPRSRLAGIINPHCEEVVVVNYRVSMVPLGKKVYFEASGTELFKR